MTRLFGAMSGLVAWAAQFTIIYGFASVVCARGYGGLSVLGIGIVPFAILGVTLLALGGAGLALLLAFRDRRQQSADAHPTDRFLVDTTLVVSGLSIAAILWQGLPALIVPACT
jgi:hypothetical protein